MIFDEAHLPKDNGATDYLDSARLAGMMAIVNHPQCPNLDNYVIGDEGVRHPLVNPNNFTRDQLIPLVSGLFYQEKYNTAKKLYKAAMRRGWRAQNTHTLDGIKKPWWQGADILTPFNMLVLARAAKINNPLLEVLGRINAVVDILYNAQITPTREPNQLICSLSVLGPRWVRFYKLMTPKWKQAIVDYWTGWRGELDLTARIIDNLEKY